MSDTLGLGFPCGVIELGRCCGRPFGHPGAHGEWSFLTNGERLDAGRAAAVEGMERAAAHAPPAWKAEAELIVDELVAGPDAWTTDDVWDELERRGVELPAERRALGTLIRRRAKAGTIYRLGYQPSRRPEHHAGPVAVWASEQ